MVRPWICGFFELVNNNKKKIDRNDDQSVVGISKGLTSDPLLFFYIG